MLGECCFSLGLSAGMGRGQGWGRDEAGISCLLLGSSGGLKGKAAWHVPLCHWLPWSRSHPETPWSKAQGLACPARATREQGGPGTLGLPGAACMPSPDRTVGDVSCLITADLLLHREDR